MKESRFDQFLSALGYCLGGESTQKWLIGNQIMECSSRLDFNMNFAEVLETLHNQGQALGKQIVSIHSRFMELHSASVDDAFSNFTSPNQVDKLAKPMNELFAYFNLRKHLGNLDKELSHEILGKARTIILRQMEVVLSKNGRWDYSLVTHVDWIFIASAMLGGADHEFFEQQNLGLPWVLLTVTLHDCISARTGSNSCSCDCFHNVSRMNQCTSAIH